MRWRTAVCLSLFLWVAFALVVAGCGGHGLFNWGDVATGATHGTSAGGAAARGPREEFNHTLLQIQWGCIAVGVAGLIASIWIPLISTRHAAGALCVGIGVAVVRPILVALYWPTIAIIALAGFAAAWPYLVAAHAWVRTRFFGKPAPIPTVGIAASLKSLVMSRAAATGAGTGEGNAGMSGGSSGSRIGLPPQ